MKYVRMVVRCYLPRRGSSVPIDLFTAFALTLQSIVIWSNKDTSVKTDREAIGKGRPQHCDCYNPGSLLRVKRHVTANISDLQKDMGFAFQIWKFDEMGEAVAKSWKHSEQQKFARVVKTNPISEGNNFIKLALGCFPSKSHNTIVSYLMD
ncbi:hypothetical protein Tco_1399914 [Tanacetum coccineum]